MFLKGSLTIIVILYIRNVLGQYKDVSQLLTDLQKGYRKEVLPTRTARSYVAVKVYPAIVRINNLDAIKEELSSTISLSLYWTDDRLEWDPKKYGGVRDVYVPASSIWLPDISVYNTVSAPEQFNDQLVEVSSLGTVLYVRNVHASSYCHVDLQWFPRDHTCEIILSSWIYTSQKMLLEFMHVNTSTTYIPVLADTDPNIINLESHQWQLVARKARAEIKRITYACCPEESYIQLKIELTVKRNTSLIKYLTDMFLFPMFVISMLVPFQFLLPRKSSSRSTLGILLVFGQILAMSMLCFNTPEFSGFSLIGIINIVYIVQAACALIVSILTSKINDKGLIPRFLQKFLPKACCERSTDHKRKHTGSESNTSQLEREDLIYKNRTTEMHDLNITSDNIVAMNSILLDVLQELRLIYSLTSINIKRREKSNWQNKSAFLDKVLFYVFLVLSVIIMIALLFVLLT